MNKAVSRIAAAVVLSLAAAGAHTALLGRRQDALEETAALVRERMGEQLAHSGWKPGQPWGAEVLLPTGWKRPKSYANGVAARGQEGHEVAADVATGAEHQHGGQRGVDHRRMLRRGHPRLRWIKRMPGLAARHSQGSEAVPPCPRGEPP